MPLRTGQMLVVIRAQDFASRTLRKVSGEFAHMSRAQMIAAKQSDLTFQKQRAQARARTAGMRMTDLRIIEEGAKAQKRYTDIVGQREAAVSRLARAEAALRQVPPVTRRPDALAQADYTKAMRNTLRIRRELSTLESQAAKNLANARKSLSIGTNQAVVMDQKYMDGVRKTQAEVDSLNKKLNQASPIRRKLAKAYRTEAAAMRALDAAQAAPLPQLRAGTGRFGAGAQFAEVANAKTAIANLDRASATVTGRLGKLDAAISKMPTGLQSLSTALRSSANGSRLFSGELSKANRRIADAMYGLDKATQRQLAFNAAVRAHPVQRLHEIGRAMSGIGRTMQLFGAVGVIGFGLAAQQAATFSKSISLAATQMTKISDGTEEAIANASVLSEKVLKLAKDFPFATEDMAAAVYEIFSSTNVQSIKEGMSLLEAFGRIAVAGQVDMTTATKASITVLNTFRGATDNVGETLNRMFAIVRFGRMTFADFAQMLPKVAAAAYGSGQTLDNMAGIMSFLTRKTGDASIAATQISRAFDVMTRKEFQEGLKTLGVNITDVEGKLLPLPEVLNKIVKRFGSLTRGGRDLERFIQIVTRASDPKTKGLLSTTEARRFFRFVFRDMKLYNDLQGKSTAATKQFQMQYETLMASPGVQWDIFLSRLRVLVIEIGTRAIPIFAQLGAHVAKLIDWWDKQSDSLKDAVVQYGVWIAVGSLAAGILLSVVGAVGGMVLTMGSAIARMGTFIAGLFGIGKAVGAAGAAGTLGKLAMLTRFLGILGAMGAILIALKVAWTGEATALDFLLGAMAGAGAGFLLGGPMGAVVGAITVPVILKVIADAKKTPQEQAFEAWEEQFKGPVEKFLGSKKFGFGLLPNILPVQLSHNREEFERQWNLLVKAYKTDVGTPGLLKSIESLDPAIVKLFQKYNKGAIEAKKNTSSNQESFEKWMKSIGIKQGSAQSDAMLKALGFDPNALSNIDKGLDKVGDFDQKMKTYTGDMKRYKEEMIGWNQQLAQTMDQAADSALDSLRSMYSTMLSENEAAMGELFQGPWLTSETFDLAKEWGITAGIDDMIKDVDMANARFAAFRASIAKVRKMGVPKAVVDAIFKMGPEAGQSFLDNIVKGDPKKVAQLITSLKKRQNQIKAATKMDFTAEINQFRKAGGSMGEAIINGFQNAGVGAWFDNWVKVKFPDVINAAVAQAGAEFRKNTPPPVAPVKPQKPRIPGLSPSAKGTAGKGSKPSIDSHDKKQEIHINMPGGYGDGRLSIQERNAAARRAAFVVGNVMKGFNF